MHSNNERVARYTLRDRGRELVVEAWEADGEQHARLLVDGEAHEEKTVEVLEDARFDLGEVEEDGKAVAQQVKVGFLWKGRVRACDLLDLREGGEGRRKRTLKTPFVPPEGTRARKRYELRERHPNLYAMRHLALEGLAIAVGFLGVSALVSTIFGDLLPSIDWSWLPDLPGIDLPDIGPPDWLRYLSPVYWVRRLWPDDWTFPDLLSWLPDWDLLSWLPDWDLGWLKAAVPLLIAFAIGLQEIERRRRRRARERRFDRSAVSPGNADTAPEENGTDADRRSPAPAQDDRTPSRGREEADSEQRGGTMPAGEG